MDTIVNGDEIPVVSVLMSVYNSGKYLAEAVQSILDQSFSSFEFIIIDDGSSDESAAVLSSFKDTRIRLITHTTNQGLINSLNRGLKEARGEFIARMDADDTCDPERLKKQVQFLHDNPEVGVCGSYVEVMGSNELYKYPLTNDAIKASMLVHNPMAHPSVMFRRKLFKDHDLCYDINYPGAEDYELWTRAIFRTGFANIGEALVKYRKHEQQVTQNKKELVRSTTGKIKLNLLENFQLNPSEREREIHLFLFNDEYKEFRIPAMIKDADLWLYKIFCANRSLKVLDENIYCDIWRTRLFVTAIKRYSISAWNILRRTYCFRFAKVGKMEKTKLLLKCMVKRKVG